MSHATNLIAAAGDDLVHSDLGVDLARLTAAIDTIFTESRAAKVSQRDAGLEALFDAEDALLLGASSPIGRRSRADAFYDANLSSGSSGQAVDSSAHTDHLLHGGPAPSSGRPRTRDDLVGQIVRFNLLLGSHLEDANQRARATITEAPRPRDPSTLETLITLAAEQVFIGLSAAVATGIRNTMQARNDVIAVEKQIAVERNGAPAPHVHMPEQAARRELSETQIEVLRELAKDATKRQGRNAAKAGDRSAGRSDTLRLESRYLLDLSARTGSLVTEIGQRYGAHAAELRRLPVEDLEEIAASLSRASAERIADAYADGVVIQWTNLVARATHEESGGSLALNRNDYGVPERQPLGVVRVELAGRGESMRVDRATLDMPNDEVVTHLRSMGGTLRHLGVHRLLVQKETFSQRMWIIDPSHTIRPIDEDEHSDGMAERFRGVQRAYLLELLNAFPVERIESR